MNALHHGFFTTVCSQCCLWVSSCRSGSLRVIRPSRFYRLQVFAVINLKRNDDRLRTRFRPGVLRPYERSERFAGDG